jgi:hypothetical protein
MFRLLRFLFCVHNRWAEFDQIYSRCSLVRRTCHTVFIKQHGRSALTDWKCCVNDTSNTPEQFAIRRLHSLTCSYNLHWYHQEIFCSYGILQFSSAWPHTFIWRQSGSERGGGGGSLKNRKKTTQVNETAPGAHWMGGAVGPTVGLDSF